MKSTLYYGSSLSLDSRVLPIKVLPPNTSTSFVGLLSIMLLHIMVATSQYFDLVTDLVVGLKIGRLLPFRRIPQQYLLFLNVSEEILLRSSLRTSRR